MKKECKTTKFLRLIIVAVFLSMFVSYATSCSNAPARNTQSQSQESNTVNASDNASIVSNSVLPEADNAIIPNQDAVIEPSSIEEPEPDHIAKATILVSELRMRRAPSTSAEILGYVEKGKEYNVINVRWIGVEKWLQIDSDVWISGRRNYVDLKYDPDCTVNNFKLSEYLGQWLVLFGDREIRLIDEFYDNGLWEEWYDYYGNGKHPNPADVVQSSLLVDIWDIEDGRFIRHVIDYVNEPYYTAHEWALFSAPDDLETLKTMTSWSQLEPYKKGARALLVSDDMRFLIRP